MTRLKNAKAFTLIELIVVIVIIGILVAIAAVAYNSIIENSKKSALKASAAQVAKIIQADSATEQKKATDNATPAADEFNAKALDFAGDGVKNTVSDPTPNDNKLTVTDGKYSVELTLVQTVGVSPTIGPVTP